MKKKISDLIRKVAIPFETTILKNSKISNFLDTEEKRYKHNFGITKLSVALIFHDLDNAKELFENASVKHNGLGIDKDLMRFYLTIFFKLCISWVENNLPQKRDEIDEKIKELEPFFMDVYRSEILEDKFFDFEAEEVDELINNMHFEDIKKISAKEFFDEVGFDSELIDEIDDILNDYENYIDVEELNYDCLGGFIVLLEQFIKVFNQDYEFKNLSYSLEILKEKIEKVDIDNLDKNGLWLYKSYIDAIYYDLKNWGNEVICEKSAKDIHYLDAALLSNIAQLDLIIK